MGSSSRKVEDALFYALFASTTLIILVDIHWIFYYAPIERTMGIVQKIFYFHVPSAYCMYLGAGACFLGSVAYFVSPTDGRDAFAKAGAETAVVFGIIMLITGPLWGAKAWGRYWTWDPRLTTSLLSVLIYVAYVVLRNFAGDGDAEKRFAAALGVLGAANLPIIHYSVQKWAGQHPVVIGKGGGGLAPGMYPPFFIALGAFTLLTVLLVWWRTRTEISRARLKHLEDDALAVLPD
ncbi:MAG TPA: cytochrome c biogenesis protein [Polyangiaceae bacterium]|nr:cytochrome c biogenesis protein [Polyangiaceae bacterium]